MINDRISRMRGFTLIEILIALGLGVALSFGLMQILQNTSDLSRTETGLSRVQEAGRFAVDFIVKDLRMMGYYGCLNPNEADVTVIASGVDDVIDTSLLGYEVSGAGNFSPALPGGDSLEQIEPSNAAAGAIAARPGSDVVRIKYATRTGLVLAASPGATISVEGNSTALKQGDLAVISDCSSAHVFRVTGVTTVGAGAVLDFAVGGNGNASNDIGQGYSMGDNLLAFQDVTYFVADTGRDTVAGDDVYALYRARNNGAAEELVEGIEYLQVQYGETVGGNNVRFVSADTPNLDFKNVESLRVGMLVQSLEQGLAGNDTNAYTVAGTQIAADGGGLLHSAGGYIRKPFSSTIKLRNRTHEDD